MKKIKSIKCKFCDNPQAYISLEDYRYWVDCPSCQSKYLLKIQKIK